jgi:uncharacterized membrane protein YidH (DUF202 family)
LHESFCADIPADDAAFYASSQRPLAGVALTEAAPTPAWRSRPAWAVLPTADRCIDPGVHHFSYERMGAAGFGAERILPAEGIIWARQVIGVSLILAGVLTAGLARWRWQKVDRAMRTGGPIPQPILGYVVGAAIVLGGLATIVLLLRADAG